MKTLLTTISALALFAAPAVAQTDNKPAAGTTGTQQSTGAAQSGAAAGASGSASGSMSAEDQEARTRATQNAERVGMQNVQVLDRVFVVQGLTPQGETVFMIVNPPGALIGIGAPTPGAAAAGNQGQQGGTATQGQQGGGSTTGATTGGTNATTDTKKN